MIREAVRSSNIATMGYDPDRLTLEVSFHAHDGLAKVWAYTPVLPVEFDALQQPGASIGSAIARFKKHGGITATLVAEVRDGIETRIL
jgi:hypothetical protein